MSYAHYWPSVRRRRPTLSSGAHCIRRVSHQLRDPGDRDVLTHHQIADQRPQVRPVAGRGCCLDRKRGCCFGPAPATATLRTMLSDDRFHQWQIEHLTGDLPNDGRVSETRPAPWPGMWRTTMSGSTTAARFLPGAPGCSPGLLPERPRRDFGAGFAYPSNDGGFDEFFEFIPSRARSSTFSAINLTIISARSDTVARSALISESSPSARPPATISRAVSGDSSRRPRETSQHPTSDT